MDVLYELDAGSKMAAAHFDWSCSPGAYAEKVSGFRVYFRVMGPTEYAQ